MKKSHLLPQGDYKMSIYHVQIRSYVEIPVLPKAEKKINDK